MSKFDSYRRGGGIFSYWIDAGNQTRVFRLSRQSLSSSNLLIEFESESEVELEFGFQLAYSFCVLAI